MEIVIGLFVVIAVFFIMFGLWLQVIKLAFMVFVSAIMWSVHPALGIITFIILGVFYVKTGM